MSTTSVCSVKSRLPNTNQRRDFDGSVNVLTRSIDTDSCSYWLNLKEKLNDSSLMTIFNPDTPITWLLVSTMTRYLNHYSNYQWKPHDDLELKDAITTC